MCGENQKPAYSVGSPASAAQTSPVSRLQLGFHSQKQTCLLTLQKSRKGHHSRDQESEEFSKSACFLFECFKQG